MVKVTWIAGSVTPSASWNGLVNNVHTYCGLEIDIIAIMPSTSCIQRVDSADRRDSTKTAFIALPPMMIPASQRYDQPAGQASSVLRHGGQLCGRRQDGARLSAFFGIGRPPAYPSALLKTPDGPTSPDPRSLGSCGVESQPRRSGRDAA